MLFMTPSKMKELSFDRVFPYDDNDLMIAVSENIVFALRKIRNSEGKIFSIKYNMEHEPKIFGEESFEKRMEGFSNMTFTRLERFFITKKSPYIFFDYEEQTFLADLFNRLALTAQVDVYEVIDNQFVKVDFNTLPLIKYTSKFKDAIRILGANFLVPPDTFVYMIGKCREYDKNFKKAKPGLFNREDRKTVSILKQYPQLSSIRTKVEFSQFKRSVSRKLHPDVNHEKGALEKFQNFMEAMNHLEKKSKWFKKLR